MGRDVLGCRLCLVILNNEQQLAVLGRRQESLGGVRLDDSDRLALGRVAHVGPRL